MGSRRLTRDTMNIPCHLVQVRKRRAISIPPTEKVSGFEWERDGSHLEVALEFVFRVRGHLRAPEATEEALLWGVVCWSGGDARAGRLAWPSGGSCRVGDIFLVELGLHRVSGGLQVGEQVVIFLEYSLERGVADARVQH